MGLLARASLLAACVASSACYTPELRDCTLACSTASDCADGQACGADGFCAGPELAGRCPTHGTRDASVGATGDAGGGGGSGGTDGGGGGTLVDAGVTPDAPPDAATHGVLTITIGGHGRVIVQNIGACEYEAAPCQFSVPLNQDVILAGFPSNDWKFDKWNAGPCNGRETSVCTFQPSLVMAAGAKFQKD
jgi:hypothetical protein